ncbi:MAG: tetratricopeptide repeat protein [Bacteroidales bacterium]|nr:tetratricopeptide repeat protein [Bacteroidales bacterium]
MKKLYIISILFALLFSCNRNRSAKEFFDLAKEYEENAEIELAVATYKQALEATEIENDTALLGLVQQYMGMLFLEQWSFEEAILMLEKSAVTTKDNPMMLSYTNAGIGRAYFIMDSIDKSIKYFENAVDYAEQSGDNDVISVAYQNIGALYQEIGNYNQALDYIRLSLRYNNEEKEIPRYHLNLAYLFYYMNENDSCSYYEDLLRKEYDDIEDKTIKIAINSFLSKRALSEDDYERAYHHYKEFAEMDMEMLHERMNQNILEIQKRYDYEKIENEYNGRLLKKQRLINIMTCALLIICLFIAIYIYNRLKKKKKELDLRNELLRYENENLKLNEFVLMCEDKISELESKIINKQGNMDSLNLEMEATKMKMNDVVKTLQKNLYWKYMLVYSMTMMENNNANVEARYKMIKGKIDGMTETSYDAIVRIFNEEHPGLAEQIKKKYPTLSETEYKVCILAFTPFTAQESAVVLGQSVNTVNKARTSIRKKLNIEEKGDIVEKLKTENLP